MSTDPRDSATEMDCAELGRTLDAYLDGEFDPREEAEAAEHLAGCERCRSAVEAQGRARAGLRAALQAHLGPSSPAGRAPDTLRERVRTALRPPPWRRALAPVPLGAAAACLAGVVVVLATHGGNDPLIDEAVRKHTRDLPLEVTAASAGPESVGRWFAGKLDFNAAPPSFPLSDVRLVGARLSHIHDRPAAYVRYDLPHGHLGLFILDDPDRRCCGGGRAVQVGPATVRLMNARGFNVAVWRRNEIVYSLVSDLAEPDLARLVEAAQRAP